MRTLEPYFISTDFSRIFFQVLTPGRTFSSDAVTQERRKQPLVQMASAWFLCFNPSSSPCLLTPAGSCPTVNSTSCTLRSRNILHTSRGCFPEEIESIGSAWHISLHTRWPASVHPCAVSLWVDFLLELSPASMFFL